jgi:NAD(P)H-dependent flavin oxidoreductase YrpB (nitropropane dioxygenase family)
MKAAKHEIMDAGSPLTALGRKQVDPVIVSGGMGIAISSWALARTVGLLGGLGVVSGMALDVVYARRLQLGDPDGHIRLAFATLARQQPQLAQTIERLLERFFIAGGKTLDQSYRAPCATTLQRVSIPSKGGCSLWELPLDTQVLTVAANFAEVWLAKRGHNGKVGINFLRKVERPLPWALYGALLAGVDYVLVGAGRPSELPRMIERLRAHKTVELVLAVQGAGARIESHAVVIQPRRLLGDSLAPLSPTKLLAIVSSHQLAQVLAEDPETRPYGFVVENPTAGGHNAPPSMKHFNEKREPLLFYGAEDKARVDLIARLGLPFWLAGSYGRPEKLQEALAMGAVGVQVGTLAALSGQSGLAPGLRKQVLSLLSDYPLRVKAESRFSPTGFPFKVAELPGSLSDGAVYSRRSRACDVGLLQSTYAKEDGSVGFRCPAEPVESFLRKGGKIQSTVGRICLCNSLLASAGFAQTRANGYVEPPLVTLGDDLSGARDLLQRLPAGKVAYSMGSALRYLQNEAGDVR